MALPATIYRVVIDLADLDRGCYARLETTAARHPSETAERLVTRLLAYALCYHEELGFTKGICAGDEPDLWSREADGRVLEWIEVGLPDADRLRKASRHAGRVVLVASGSGLRRWLEQHQAKLASVPNLTILALDAEFIGRLAASLERAINWSLTVTEGTLYLTRGGETLEAPLHLIQGER
ncbi:YaeQ family protein [Desulfuromonas sp. KJ2020]|uniref:YaeQ family protein n=1 Tax=Desulfuromonas sp. KJ2020 TaxID=2919173 RepID=UPI0020A71F1D|nr:YaeQ family protein [Desulfuromonas sp. KJ2020]MCP3176491.1 YaeQ family protein [Desulfuromonas sp. KJ2020]